MRRFKHERWGEITIDPTATYTVERTVEGRTDATDKTRVIVVSGVPAKDVIEHLMSCGWTEVTA